MKNFFDWFETTQDPRQPWLLLGSLQAQARQDAAAETSLKRYVDLAANQKDAEDRQRGTTQAYLVLSQLAERRKDFTAAERWLARVDSTDEGAAADPVRACALRETAEETGVRLDEDDLVPWAHWITPELEPRRYDTYFFLAGMPPDQEAQDVSGGNRPRGVGFSGRSAGVCRAF